MSSCPTRTTLGDQWSIGDWKGMRKAAATELPAWMREALMAMNPLLDGAASPEEPPRNLREYDPEWGRAFVTGFAMRRVTTRRC
jgi:hypothetical protein